MIHTTLPAKRAIAQIVNEYRRMLSDHPRPLSLRKFASDLSEVLQPQGGRISHQSVKNWQDRKYLPKPFYMLQIARHAPADWRRDFALDILAIVLPQSYRPVTEIGVRANRENQGNQIDGVSVRNGERAENSRLAL